MDREELHRLVDTLPEFALKHATNMLRHFQVWPPQPPQETQDLQREHRERIWQGPDRGVGGGGGIGGGRYSTDQSGKLLNGTHSFRYRENGESIIETHWFHRGNKTVVVERMRAAADGKTLRFKSEVMGPDGKRFEQDLTFEMKK
jgi:hypothetical protein